MVSFSKVVWWKSILEQFKLHRSVFNFWGDAQVCVWWIVLEGVHWWPTPSGVQRPSLVLPSFNNGKGNGLPKASSCSLTAVPASGHSCHKTISSIYQPYIHHHWQGRREGRRQKSRERGPGRGLEGRSVKEPAVICHVFCYCICWILLLNSNCIIFALLMKISSIVDDELLDDREWVPPKQAFTLEKLRLWQTQSQIPFFLEREKFKALLELHKIKIV